MKRISVYLIFSLVFLGLQASAKAQDILVPAGTLIRCTLDEPNFSSATADIGDPVICHLNSLREFGQNVFPRGSYLGGHLEADKEPGHFVGKGYLKCNSTASVSLPRISRFQQGDRCQGLQSGSRWRHRGRGHST